MSQTYGRDLDLNLLRAFAVVADAGSVTVAAQRLYLTQPAVSAALRRLATSVGAPLFVRQGRRLALTARGVELRARVELHLPALVAAALAPPEFDPVLSESTVRLGLSDATEVWLLPRLLRVLEKSAPRLRLVSMPVQFRNVAEALISGSVELAVTVADELPAGVRRQTLFSGDFVCLFDPRRVKWRPPVARAAYFGQEHVVVSYNGDLRGIVEDLQPRARRVRCSVSSFANLGAIVEGSALVATVPRLVAAQIRALRPKLAWAELPFELSGAPVELLWSAVSDDDGPSRFVRGQISQISGELGELASADGHPRRRKG